MKANSKMGGSREFAAQHCCWLRRCLHSFLLLLLLPDLSHGQQQLFFRPADQQWYFQAPGQQAQPLQQQQFQVGFPTQQSTAPDSGGPQPQFQFQPQQPSAAPNQQQQQSQIVQQQASPAFFFQSPPQQPQFDAPSQQQSSAAQFFPQNQQFQFAGPPPPPPSPSTGQHQQFVVPQQQPQFVPQPQQFQQLQFAQPQFQQPHPMNWFVPSSGPGEFQEQLPELIRPPQTLIQRADPSPPQHQQQQAQPQQFFGQQQEFSLPQPPPPPPPPHPPQLFQQPFFFPQNQQPNQTPPQQQQPQIAPPVPPPRIVHIQTQQEFHDILPQLFQMPVLAEQVTPSSNGRILTAAPRRPAQQQKIGQQRRVVAVTTSSRRPPPPPPTTTAERTTTTPRPTPPPPPPPPPPAPAPMLVKEEKEPVEFDLPPPPPARFLPEGEKIRIAEFLRQQSRAKNQGIHAGLITDFPTLVRSITPPAVPAATTPKTPRRSTLARLAAVPDQEVGDGGNGQKKDPNKVFLDCCKRKRVAKQCESRCNFDVLNKKILTGMFLGSDKCPAENGLDLFTCAAQDQDHTECCLQSRVHKTAAADKCLAFCNLAPDAPRIQLDASYLPCWAVLNEVKSCFRENILKASGDL